MNIRSYQDALYAVNQDIKNIIYIPKSLITTEIMLLIYKKDPMFKFAKYSFTSVVHTTPKRYVHININEIFSHNYYEEDKDIIPENYLLAVQLNGNNLKHIPIEKRTSKLCEIAVLKDPLALQFVPEKYKTYHLCLIATKNSGMALEYVPIEKKTPELCYLAIKNSLLCWDDIPDPIKKGLFIVNTNDITHLKCYIRFVSKKRQKREYIVAFFYKASYKDIEELSSFIALKGIPTHYLPLLINIPNGKLRKYARNKLGRI
jgi:hypothetical protein